uniref:Uncharacterized protein n=1 Tax=Anopheles christyi TaxID=43041 RepID=A0A182K2P3_9DIPT
MIRCIDGCPFANKFLYPAQAIGDHKTTVTRCLTHQRVLENSYHGLIKENETFVEITPLIKVDETKICGFHIIKKNKEIPFQRSLSVTK